MKYYTKELPLKEIEVMFERHLNECSASRVAHEHEPRMKYAEWLKENHIATYELNFTMFVKSNFVRLDEASRHEDKYVSKYVEACNE